MDYRSGRYCAYWRECPGSGSAEPGPGLLFVLGRDFGFGCCHCDQDWAGWWWCYDGAIIGGADCQAGFNECISTGYCLSLGSANSDALAPDGSVYAMVAAPEFDPRVIVSRTTLGHEAQWEVICDGVIASRTYSAEALRELNQRIRTITL